jgi:3-isopropylmalate/(R)-2-methylmalate dehydratase small subunit
MTSGQGNPGFRAQQAGLSQRQSPGRGRELRLRVVARARPWSILDFGIRCVIAPSFADIFYNNCFKNGILPIRLPQETCDKLMKAAENGANATFTVDLAAQEITTPDGETVAFEVDSFRKHCLLNGLDDIGLTLVKKTRIDAYESARKTAQPWV